MKLTLAALGVLPVDAISSGTIARAMNLSRSGPWEAFGGTDDAGDEGGGVSTHWDDGSYFGVKRYENDNFLTVQIMKPTWRIDGNNVDVQFEMDNDDSWSADGGTDRGGDTIWFTVPALRLPDFISEFTMSQRMALDLGGNVHWDIDLTGTEDVTKSFADCLDEMDK